MRRVKTAGLLVAALAAAALVAGAVSAGAESGPACADITGETHGPLSFYNGTTGGTLNVRLLTASGTACKQVTYTLAVSGVTGGPIVQSQQGNADFTVTYADSDNKVCISATTSAGGRHAHDAAPDAGCLELTSGTTGGGSGFG